MGISSSKEDTDAIVRRSMKGKEILDEEGFKLREEVDKCLSSNMWWCTAVGVVLSIPASIIYKTQKPLLAAAIASPLLDMAYATQKCSNERDAFLAHYTKLREQFQQAMAEGSDASTSNANNTNNVNDVNDAPVADDIVRSREERSTRSQPLPGGRSIAGKTRSTPAELDSNSWSSKETSSAVADEGIVFEDLPMTDKPKKKGWW